MCSLLKNNDCKEKKSKLTGKGLAAIIAVCTVLVALILSVTALIDSQLTESRVERLIMHGVDPLKASCAVSIYDGNGKLKENCK